MIDLKAIQKTVLDRYADAMRQGQQPSLHHGEGDVLTHTYMVRDALHSLTEYQALTERQQDILIIAALLHDIGKIPTTKVIGGGIEAPRHAPVGAAMAREHLWINYGLCGSEEAMRIREAIYLLVRYHSIPVHAIDAEDGALRLHRIAANGLVAPDFTIRMLCILAKADMLGRICNDQQQMLDQIALCEELAREEGCLESCYPFNSNHLRHSYLHGNDVWKEQTLYDDTWGEVVIMSGLPGTGKDTWIANNLSGIPMISLDDIRRAHGIDPLDDQGFVANIAKEQAKEYLRRHQPFVWNATNITAQTRGKLIRLFESYRARVRIVYLETDWQTQLQRNSSRLHMVPPGIIHTMLKKLTPPEPQEGAQVEWLTL